MVALADQRGDARVEDVGRAWVLVVGVGPGGNHLHFTIGADRRRIWEELTAIGQLLLGEAGQR